MSYCVQCGVMTSDTARFCTSCGATVRAGAADPTPRPSTSGAHGALDPAAAAIGAIRGTDSDTSLPLFDLARGGLAVLAIIAGIVWANATH